MIINKYKKYIQKKHHNMTQPVTRLHNLSWRLVHTPGVNIRIPVANQIRRIELASIFTSHIRVLTGVNGHSQSIISQTFQSGRSRRPEL